MSIRLTPAATLATVASVILVLSSHLPAAEPVSVGKKCDAHAKEWERLQNDKKWSLEHFKGDKEEFAHHQEYYAQKEAILLRKMMFCDKCGDKHGKVEDLQGNVGGNGGKPTGPGAGGATDPHIARGQELAKIPQELLFPKHITIVAQPGARVIERVSNELNFDPRGNKIIVDSVDQAFRDQTTEWVFIVNDQGRVVRSWDRPRYEAELKNRQR